MIAVDITPPALKAGLSRLWRVAVLTAALCAPALSVCGLAHADDGPPPPSDPRDISGIWYSTGFSDAANRSFKPLEGGAPPFTPAGLAIYTERREAEKSGRPKAPTSYCTPTSFPLTETRAPNQIIQTPGQVTFISEMYHDVNIVRLDKQHPRKVTPSFMGDSVGHWDGDTLVIDTVGFRPDRWLDYTGTPASAALRIVERLRKVTTPGGKTVLENVVTLIDPTDYAMPWSVRRVYLWRPNERVTEEICEEDLGQQTPEAADPAPSGAIER
jgi:hypothetical protein